MLDNHDPHIDPKTHPDVPRIRNVNDIAECLITASIAMLVNERVGAEMGCPICRRKP